VTLIFSWTTDEFLQYLGSVLQNYGSFIVDMEDILILQVATMSIFVPKELLSALSHPNPLVEPLTNDITNSTLAYRELCTVFSDC
jgi:hypothetical protein